MANKRIDWINRKYDGDVARQIKRYKRMIDGFEIKIENINKLNEDNEKKQMEIISRRKMYKRLISRYKMGVDNLKEKMRELENG